MKIPRTPLEHLEYGHRYRVEGIKHLEEAFRLPELSREKIREQRKADLCIAIADRHRDIYLEAYDRYGAAYMGLVLH